MIDPAVLTDRLLAFIGIVAAYRDQPDLDQHLRFPTITGGVFRGSELGRSVWDSEAGQALIDVLLEDETLSAFHRREPEYWLTEIRGRVASLVVAALGAEDVGGYASSMAPVLVEELAGAPTTTTYFFIRGISVGPDGFALSNWLWLSPATEAALEALGAGLPNGGLVTIPNDATGVVSVALPVDRGTWGVTAAASAASWAEVVWLQVRDAIWLSSGIPPRVAFRGQFSDAQLPDIRPSLEFAEPLERAGDLPDEVPVGLVPDRVHDAFLRTYMLTPWDAPWARRKSARLPGVSRYARSLN